jgi:Icc-related predicted phosphoesterase
VRILLVSDLHYSLKQFDWLVSRKHDYDLIVLAGDSLDVAALPPLDAQSVVVLEYLSLLQSSTRLAVSSGNHDLTGPDDNGEQCALWLSEARVAGIPTDGDSLRLDDTLVTICPWWDGPTGRELVAAKLTADADHRPARWVWVYHWPPSGSPTCWTGSRDYGDSDLGEWITQHQPDLVLCGHVHQSPFADQGSWKDRLGATWVFNAGHQRGPIPARIEIDLSAGTAHWTSLMGTEAVNLG